MSQNNYVETYGTALKFGTTPGTYTGMTQIAGMKAIGSLAVSRIGKFEITRIDQAAIDEQFAPSLRNNGVLQVTLGMFKTDYNTLIGFGRTLKPWQILFSQASTDSFDGFIELIGPKSEGMKDEVVVDLSICVSGARVFTP